MKGVFKATLLTLYHDMISAQVLIKKTK